MTTSLTITVEDYESLFNLNERNVIFKDGSTCPLDLGMCFNNFKGTTTWTLKSHENCDTSSVDILYQGEVTLVSQVEHKEINIFDMVMVNKNDNIFSYRIDHISHICYQKIYKTNLNRISILLENPTYGFYFKKQRDMNSQNLDFPMYLNAKMEFISHSLKNDIAKLFTEMSYADCELAREMLLNKLSIARINDIFYGHIIDHRRGYMNIFTGHIFYSYQCVPMLLKIRETERCYKNIPVTYNNISKFLEPSGHTITDHSNEIPCARLTPAKFFINNMWVANDGRFAVTTAPKVSPTKHDYNIKFENLDNILAGGIYNKNINCPIREILI